MGRGDLSEVQWARLEPLLPARDGAGRPPIWSKRQLIDGIRWRIRAGVPWRDVPERYGPWQTVYGLFRRWQRDGYVARVVTGLQAQADADGLITWDVSVDSTVNRAHQHAGRCRKKGSCQKESPGGVVAEPADHALGRSRGGFTTKIHLAVEQGQKPLSIFSPPGIEVTVPSLSVCWRQSRCPASVAVGPAVDLTGCWPTRPTAPPETAPTCAGAGSGRPSRSKPTRLRTDANEVPQAGGRRRSTPKSTSATCGRVRYQQAQTTPRRRDPVRQTRRPLPGHGHDRRHRRMATILKQALAPTKSVTPLTRRTPRTVPRTT